LDLAGLSAQDPSLLVVLPTVSTLKRELTAANARMETSVTLVLSAMGEEDVAIRNTRETVALVTTIPWFEHLGRAARAYAISRRFKTTTSEKLPI